VDANQPQTAEKGENLESQLDSTQNSSYFSLSILVLRLYSLMIES